MNDFAMYYVWDTTLSINKFIAVIQLEMQTKSPYIVFRNNNVS